MFNKSIHELSVSLSKKEFSSVELTQFFLNRIENFDSKLNSLITLCAEQALNEAKQADKIIASNKHNVLTGIPVLHKDIFCTKDIKTSCGSKMLDNFIAPYDATVVNNLKHAGTVILGKTNMDEFAMGSSNEHSYYGPVKNPWNTDLVPGGSSGGSAAAVAARLAPIATGTDTGGSIRQPAAFCGITGFKPSYGLVSRFGMIAYASSLDQGGPMAISAKDCAIVLEHMASYDLKDSTSYEKQPKDFTADLEKSIKGLKIGLPKQYFSQELDSAISNKIMQAVDKLKELGCIIKEVELPNAELSIPTYYVIASAECSSNLARYDGVRYGYRTDKKLDLNEFYKTNRSEGFGTEVKRRILTGTYVLSAGYYDAYYVKAQKVRTLIANDFKQAFEQVDIIVSPTTPNLPFKIGAKTQDPIEMYLNDIYTTSINLAGLPAISIPVGFLNELPIGMQMIGPAFHDSKVLNAAHQLQKITDWHIQTPKEFI